MALALYQEAQTVANTAPWLLTPSLSVICRCSTEFRPQASDEIEADGSVLCRPCAITDRIWHAEANLDAVHGTGAFDRG